MFKKYNKRGAIGAAMTWLVATIVILLLVILFVYFSYVLAQEKKITNLDISILSDSGGVGADSGQILLALLKTRDGERSVENYISRGEYEQVKDFVENILEKFPELEGNTVIHMGGRHIELNDNSLKIK
jgi:hypothetical protein|tara:strand:- start:22 stop:408 length:387 start_codon:yes stop_codon:yes gene_type:complete